MSISLKVGDPRLREATIGATLARSMKQQKGESTNSSGLSLQPSPT